MIWIMGIDQSANCTACAACPLDWDGQWNRIQTMRAGESLRRDATDHERAYRTDSIARQVVEFARKHGVSKVWFESYAYAQARAAHTLAEVGGVIRVELMRAGVVLNTANMSSARKLLLGKLPKSDAKGAVFKMLHDMGARFETMDEADAFVCLNWGMSELGGYCFAQVT